MTKNHVFGTVEMSVFWLHAGMEKLSPCRRNTNEMKKKEQMPKFHFVFVNEIFDFHKSVSQPAKLQCSHMQHYFSEIWMAVQIAYSVG